MTRILSELLGVNEHQFRSSLARLEQASGHPNADIQLSSQLSRAAQTKIAALGLDPHDTTGPELYAALQTKFEQDDQRLVVSLLARSKQIDSLAAVAETVRTLPLATQTYALKPAVAKLLLKRVLPKRTMKRLGYRSFDSMVKHEALAAIYAAAFYLESAAWQRQLHESYKKLTARDFENRKLIVAYPETARWQDLASEIITNRRHTIVSFAELGALVILPVADADRPPAVASTTLILALKAVNDIRAASTFLKVCQVKADFGSVVQMVATTEPTLRSELLDRPVPWHIIQRYYARFRESFNASVFEPHVQLDDLSWHSIEQLLEHIEPSLHFWRGTAHLGQLQDHQVISFNIIDVAINHTNQLLYAERLSLNAQVSLWHELLLRYLKHENIEQTVISQLQAELVPQPALA